MAKRIVVFNHKGGVSKTTSVYNIGWMLSKKYRVLVVDADSQCNLSSLILGDGFDEYYTNPKTKNHNIKDGVAPAFSGRPIPLKAVDCFFPERAPKLFLLAGNPNLSEYDSSLAFSQMSNNAIATLQNLPGAFHELIRLTEEKYEIDYTLIDLNPSLSAINQNLFLNSNGFLIPTNPDPFSIMAIDVLKKILPRWTDWKKNNQALFEDSAYPMWNGTPKFLGSLIQGFNVRNGKAATPYQDNINEIKEKIAGDFFKILSQHNMTLQFYPQEIINNNYNLSEIPNFQGLLPQALAAYVPVFELANSEINYSGAALAGMDKNRENFKKQFEKIANDLVAMVKNA